VRITETLKMTCKKHAVESDIDKVIGILQDYKDKIIIFEVDSGSACDDQDNKYEFITWRVYIKK
jgi:hypothetical protein